MSLVSCMLIVESFFLPFLLKTQQATYKTQESNNDQLFKGSNILALVFVLFSGGNAFSNDSNEFLSLIIDSIEFRDRNYILSFYDHF